MKKMIISMLLTIIKAPTCADCRFSGLHYADGKIECRIWNTQQNEKDNCISGIQK
jgi:hypothetical protein